MGKHTSFSFSYYRIWPIWWEEDLWGETVGKTRLERERERGRAEEFVAFSLK